MYEEPEEEHGFHVGSSWEQDCEGRGGTLLVEGIIIARRCGVCPSNMVWYVVQAGRKFHVSQGDRILSCGWWTAVGLPETMLGSFLYMAMAVFSTAA